MKQVPGLRPKALLTMLILGDVDLHSTFATSEIASTPTMSIDAYCPSCDVEELALGLRPYKQHGIPSASAQAQPQTLPQSSAPQHDQTNQQGIGSVTWSASVGLAPYSLPKPSDSGDDGCTDEDTAELEKELGLALEKQQVESSLACTPPSQVLARSRNHRTISRVENAAEPPLAY